MPYNCDDCGNIGGRMNLLFGIRLCKNCQTSFKYKLICKSKALKQYKLTQNDLENVQIEKYLCKNPYNKSGNHMTLYFEFDIQQIFLDKYEDIIKNKLHMPNPNEELNLDRNVNYYESINKVLEYLNEK